MCRLPQSDGEGSFDAGFIDANKSQYDEYYELLLRLLRPGGVIAIDNVIWGGDVLDASVQDADTKVCLSCLPAALSSASAGPSCLQRTCFDVFGARCDDSIS